MSTPSRSKSRSVTTRAPLLPAVQAVPPAARAKAPASEPTPKPTPKTAPKAAPPHPDGEAVIRELAYSLYEREGCVDGRATDHWLQAEALVAQGLASKT